MNYNTFSFWLFFFAVFALYWRLDHRWQNRLMLVASYVFYAWWDYRFLFLILISTVIDFIGGLGVAGRRLEKTRLRRLGLFIVGSSILLAADIRYGDLFRGLQRGDFSTAALALPHTLRAFAVPIGAAVAVGGYGLILPRLYALPEKRRRITFLAISMTANLFILGFFKYFDFFIANLRAALELFGLHPDLATLNLILPAGISFYTFQAMSYTVDIYRGAVKPTEEFFDFALFVCFFPHLVAGPIMRAHTLLLQVEKPRVRDHNESAEGLLLILVGLFKKLVIADNLAVVANAVFYRFGDGKDASITGPEALLGIYAFAFQIYGDFSGYSAIARGLAKLLGFELVVNFDHPYIAESPSDFWTRWHISLSSWLRDYLYIPLGGNRKGPRMQYRNLMLTMLLGGLWHGAAWTYIVWGFYHGAILCIFRLFDIPDRVQVEKPSDWLRKFLRIVLMFHLTCIGWLIFRADSFGTVVKMATRIVSDPRPTFAAASGLVLIAFYAAPLFVAEIMLKGERHLGRMFLAPQVVSGLSYAYLLLMILFFNAEKASEFIYFQF